MPVRKLIADSDDDGYNCEMMESANKAVYFQHKQKLALDEVTGMAPFSMDTMLAERTLNDVKNCLNRGVCEGNGHFVFYVRFGKRSKRIEVKGFNTYQINHGEQDENNGERQMKHTTTFTPAQIRQTMQAFPSFCEVVDLVTESYGMEVVKMDILRQSSTGVGGGKEALFKWHRDNDGDRTDVRLTVIFSLTQTESSMEVLGFKRFHYDKPGCGIAFPSKYWHRSVQAEPGTIKIALFLSGTSKRCETKAWMQCICKKLDPPTKKRGWLVEDWFQCNACDRWCHGVCAQKHGKFVGDEFFCCR